MARAAARLPDWIFSAPSKRRVIAYVLAERNQGELIGERDVAKAIGADVRGSVDEHLCALAQLGLLERQEGPRRFRVLETAEMDAPERQLRAALVDLLEALESIPEVAVERPR